tara:strand:+ start:455 stop:646 length:192 start_codon:yes stop_codon:yes gene_type:complete
MKNAPKDCHCIHCDDNKKPITINATDIINGKKEELEKIIPNNNYNPNESYKKAVNTLKRSIKR